MTQPTEAQLEKAREIVGDWYRKHEPSVYRADVFGDLRSAIAAALAEASTLTDDAAFHRGVDAAMEAIRSESDGAADEREEVGFWKACFINAIARKCGFDRPSPNAAADICAEMAREADSDPVSTTCRKVTANALREAERRIRAAAPSVSQWQPMKTCPRDASWVIALLPSGGIVKAHWAQDHSGEHQPAFEGWFDEKLVEIDTPIGWMPLPTPPKGETE